MRFGPPVPLLRIFDEAQAMACYVDWLGFKQDWQHRFGPDFPLYAQISRGAAVLHLTGHWGDCTPGARVRIEVDDIEALAADLAGRPNRFMRPGIEDQPWARELAVLDPFGNWLVFWQSLPQASPG